MLRLDIEIAGAVRRAAIAAKRDVIISRLVQRIEKQMLSNASRADAEALVVSEFAMAHGRVRIVIEIPGVDDGR